MWIKLDDGFATHPKILAAGPIAALIQIRALCYASQNRTDGLIPHQALPLLLTGFDLLGITTGKSDFCEFGQNVTDIDWPAEMVRGTLWHPVPEGYRIHGFLEWNLSKKDYGLWKKKLSKGGQKGMKARWGTGLPSVTQDITHDITQVITQDITYPVTRGSIATLGLSSLHSPDQTPNLKSKSEATDFDHFWAAYPKKIGKKAARAAWEKARDKPAVVDVLQAIDRAKHSEQWRKENGQFIPHASTWLNQGRWDDEPATPNGGATRPPPPPPKNDPIGRGHWGLTYGNPKDYGYE